MMRGFQICPRNSHQITFDAPFGPKKTVEICHIGYFANFRVFVIKKGENVIWFKFWDQIWNPLIKWWVLASLRPHLLRFSHFDWFFLRCHAHINSNTSLTHVLKGHNNVHVFQSSLMFLLLLVQGDTAGWIWCDFRKM